MEWPEALQNFVITGREQAGPALATRGEDRRSELDRPADGHWSAPDRGGGRECGVSRGSLCGASPDIREGGWTLTYWLLSPPLGEGCILWREPPWDRSGGHRLGPLALPLPGSAAILAACGLEARTPDPLSQTGTAQGSGGPPSNVMCITPPQRATTSGGPGRLAG